MFSNSFFQILDHCNFFVDENSFDNYLLHDEIRVSELVAYMVKKMVVVVDDVVDVVVIEIVFVVVFIVVATQFRKYSSINIFRPFTQKC